MNTTGCGLLLLLVALVFSLVVDNAEAKPYLLIVDEESDEPALEPFVVNAGRAKRSFDRLDSSPFGFAATARGFIDIDRLKKAEATIVKTSSLETLPAIPRKRLFYRLNDGYLFG
ncbi:hypothetical protein AAVH_11842 [Aphelenchoides avenae]|nr:hypothetical protein AAVH_34548 [Aphelenchus avenae]KAH7720635.1 hypothetical protein AAVH_11842 [Aphelenchus avenae]